MVQPFVQLVPFFLLPGQAKSTILSEFDQSQAQITDPGLFRKDIQQPVPLVFSNPAGGNHVAFQTINRSLLEGYPFLFPPHPFRKGLQFLPQGLRLDLLVLQPGLDFLKFLLGLQTFPFQAFLFLLKLLEQTFLFFPGDFLLVILFLEGF